MSRTVCTVYKTALFVWPLKQIANNDESSSSFETLCETVFFRAEKDDTAVKTGKEEIGAEKIIGVMGVERGASFVR